jgi:Carboxypeptidase regulatory-like domain/TonB dependent receptor
MRRFISFLLVVISASIPLAAQIDRTEVNGTVVDASGSVIADAQVELVQDGTGAIRQVTTSGRGTFVISSLPVGRFTLTISKVAFTNFRLADIDLHSGDIRTINARLLVSGANQSVYVEVDTGANLDNNNATVGGTIQSVQVARLPLNGRNIATLELLAPGGIDSGSGTQASIRFAGQGIDDNNFRFDGVDASGIYRQAVKSGLRLQFSTEAVAEFRVDAGGYTADTGGSAGGQVSLISKSGTNKFHGSVFDYLRNSYFDALSPIKTTVHPGFHLNQFGGNVGGPIVRDRTFFFVNYEGFRQSLGGVPQTGFVPSPAFRAQVAAAQPSLAAIINNYPQGSAPTADPNVSSFTGVVPSPNQENSGVVRVDHRISSKDSAYARYSIDDGFSTSALNALAQSITIQSRIQNLALEETHIFSPTFLNEAQLGFNRNTFIQNQQTGSPYNFSITGFTTLSENYSKAQVPTSFSGNDTITLSRGVHTIKAGVDIRFVMYNEANSVDGTASYTSPANLLANKLDSILVTAALPDKGLRKMQYAGYLQDQWKLSKTFTLNLGMRYNYFAPLYEQHNNANPFDLASCGGYCGMGTTFYFPNTKDFDPRVSFAYSPDVFRGNTVFRAGFGIYHGEIQLGDEDSPVVNTEPSTLLTSSASNVYSYPSALPLIPTTGLAQTPRSLLRHHPDSYTEQWTGSVQQSLGQQTVLTFTYLGIKGNHLFRRTYTNLIDPATGLRPLGSFFPSQIDTKANQGMSIFHAFQANLTHRFHNGFFVAGNYMFSHALDDGSVGAGEADAAENVACFRCDYAGSDFDVRHSGNASVVYDLPFGRGRRFLNSSKLADAFVGGWSVDSLLYFRSGLPLNVTVSRSSTVLPDGNNVNQRPNRVPGVPIYSGNRGITSWLNPAAFAIPAAGTWGNGGRNIAVGPNFWQDDTALEKLFSITERYKVIFRAEAFNLFNRAQYGQPSGSFNTASFGHITSVINTTGLVGTGTPRQMEFALRLNY